MRCTHCTFPPLSEDTLSVWSDHDETSVYFFFLTLFLSFTMACPVWFVRAGLALVSTWLCSKQLVSWAAVASEYLDACLQSVFGTYCLGVIHDG